jgi:hypothetical protein
VAEDTAAGLSELAKEFGSSNLKNKVSLFMVSPEYKIDDLEREIMRLEIEASGLKIWTAPKIDSKISSDFPSVFMTFEQNGLNVFCVAAAIIINNFPEKCDNHSNALTIIRDTNGHIFDSFTPTSWESQVWNWTNGPDNNTWKCDECCQSFLFTLRNPHHISARMFRLRLHREQFAVTCE